MPPSSIPATTGNLSSTSTSYSPTTTSTSPSPSTPLPFSPPHPDANVFFFSAAIHSFSLHSLHFHFLSFYVLVLSSSRSLLPNAFAVSLFNIGRAVHTQSVKFFVHSYPNIATTLLDMCARCSDVNGMQVAEREVITMTVIVTCYAKAGNLKSAREVFEGMGERDFVCCNAMTDGYVQHGRLDKVLRLFRRIVRSKVTWNEVTTIWCCWRLRSSALSRWGVKCICTIENNMIEFNVQVGTTLVDMYSKCRSLEDACLVFDKIHDMDVAAWNLMIGRYVMHRQSQKVLKLITMLRSTDVAYNVHQSVECK